MFELQQMQRFERTFFRFTRVELHVLGLLQRLSDFLQTREAEPPRFLVCARPRSNTRILLIASLGRSQQEVVLHAQGLRPVRYHVQTANTALGRRLRRYFHLVLGEPNLLPQASTQTGAKLSLVYHVRYPEEILRQLGS